MISIFYRYQKIITIISILLGLLWIIISTLLMPVKATNLISTPKEGFQAPDFSLATPSNEYYSTSDLQGNAILVNFWTSWCPPCKEEMPILKNVYEKYKEQGFIILAVNSTRQDNTSQVISYIDEMGINFPVLLDTHGIVTSQYKINSFPSSFFINRKGIIEEIVIGGPMSEVLLQTRIEGIIGEGD